MTEGERLARGHRARAAWEEFVEPMLSDIDAEYMARMVEVANSELIRDKRADKITALSNALRINSNLRAGMLAIITDGDVAQREKIKADRIERMTAPQRRLLGIAPY